MRQVVSGLSLRSETQRADGKSEEVVTPFTGGCMWTPEQYSTCTAQFHTDLELITPKEIMTII